MMQNLSASTLSVLCLGVALNIVSFSNLQTQATQTLLNTENQPVLVDRFVDGSPKPGNGRRESKDIAQTDSRQGSSPIRGNGRRDSKDQTPLQA
jgi:hypothetical protein